MKSARFTEIVLSTPSDSADEYNICLRKNAGQWTCSVNAKVTADRSRTMRLIEDHSFTYAIADDDGPIEFNFGEQSTWVAIAMAQAIFGDEFKLDPPEFWYHVEDSPLEFRVETGTVGRHKIAITCVYGEPADQVADMKRLARSMQASDLCVAAWYDPNGPTCRADLSARATARSNWAYRELVNLHPLLQ